VDKNSLEYNFELHGDVNTNNCHNHYTYSNQLGFLDCTNLCTFNPEIVICWSWKQIPTESFFISDMILLNWPIWTHFRCLI
jgi:hypothetical protein